MRRLTAALAALVTALGLALVVAGPAEASITSPTNGSVVSGTIVLSDTGATDSSSLCITGSSAQTQVRVFNSANATVFNQTKSGAGAASFTWDTHAVPNGAYRLQTDVRNKSGTLFCSNSSSTFTSNFTITNTVTLTYGSALSAPQNTTIPVSATLVDPSTSTGVSGLTVSFALSGGTTVTASTNAAGVASATLPISGPPRGATLSVSFAGTAFFAATTKPLSFDVTKNATTTTVVQPATVVHGEPVSFTANVARVNGTDTPGGTVQFKVDGANLGAAVPLSGAGSATSAATTSLSTGAHTVTAIYSGDGNFLGSTSADVTATVAKAVTTTTLTSAPNPTKYGQAVTFTAEVAVVAPGAGTPTGGVQFNIDGQPFGTAVPLSGDTATLTVSNLSAGNHDVEAVYNGDADFKTSSSAVVTQGVDRADTNLTLTTSDPTAVSGEPLTYTANVVAVAPGAGTPPGQVQFEVDGTPLGGPVTLVNGQATSPTTHLLVGPHNVTADYLGDANFGGSNDLYVQDVAAAQTTTTVSSSPNPSVFGQAVTLHGEVAPVAPATGTPSGAIRFCVDGTTLAIVDAAAGAADYTVSTLAVGSHDVKATFLSDDSNFLPSTSPTIQQQVNKAATTTAVTSNAATSVFGQPVTFTASVSVQSPGAGAPAGTVTFSDGTTVLASVPVSSATGFQAAYTTDGLSVGQHAITAEYSGDDSFLGSSASATQTVQKASTGTVVTSSNNPLQSGQSTVFTAVVSPIAPGAGLPGGTVLFTVNGLPLGGARPLVGGVATSPSFSALTPGTYKVQAQYSGDGNFLKSTGLLDQGAGQNVTKGSTSMTLAAAPDPATYGSPVTFSTTVSAVAPATGKPSGVVRFWQGTELLGSVSLTPSSSGSSSTAEFVDSSLTPGAHSVRAEYVGNFNFTGTDATTSVTVGRAPTVVGVSSSANPSTFGDDVTFTATVGESLTPTGSTPSGSVTFKDGSAVLGTATLSTVDGHRVATLTVSGLAGGAHPITAEYGGDTVFAGSTSPVVTQNVSRSAPSLLAGTPKVNNKVTATLTGVGGAPLAGETIAFWSAPSDGYTKHLCDAVTDANGVASCDETVINIVIGGSFDGAYTARFGGDANYLPAESGASQF